MLKKLKWIERGIESGSVEDFGQVIVDLETDDAYEDILVDGELAEILGQRIDDLKDEEARPFQVLGLAQTGEEVALVLYGSRNLAIGKNYMYAEACLIPGEQVPLVRKWIDDRCKAIDAENNYKKRADEVYRNCGLDAVTVAREREEALKMRGLDDASLAKRREKALADARVEKPSK
ncbi:hypothetical protein KKC60_01895 [Patescibacteria group bacterium]|nr:hypothetical protein [Patescibacteria group bacterium]